MILRIYRYLKICNANKNERNQTGQLVCNDWVGFDQSMQAAKDKQSQTRQNIDKMKGDYQSNHNRWMSTLKSLHA